MTRLGTGFASPLFAGFFLVWGNGGGGVEVVVVVGFESESGESHQSEDDDFSSLFIEQVCGFFIETVFSYLPDKDLSVLDT